MPDVFKRFLTDKKSQTKLYFRPFVTVGKPTCGANYIPVTDHKKRKTGIPPTNLVKFRPQTASVVQKSSPGSAHGRPSIAVDLK